MPLEITILAALTIILSFVAIVTWILRRNGRQGEPGARGRPGADGHTGERGRRGRQGIQGPKGERGEDFDEDDGKEKAPGDDDTPPRIFRG